MVKMTDLLTENCWFWERGRFMNRRYLMQEVYQDYLEGDDVSKILEKNDPFWEAAEEELVGTANIFLQSLSYNLQFEDSILVSDYKGEDEGSITVNVAPCSASGTIIKEEQFVEDPSRLVGEPFHFKVTIKDASVYTKRFMKGLKVSYRLNPKAVFTETDMVRGMLNPVFNHSKVFTFDPLTAEHIDFFTTGSITFWMYAAQQDDPSTAAATTTTSSSASGKTEVKLTTKELKNKKGRNCQHRGSTMIDRNNQQHLKAELLLLQKKNERLAQKERRIQQLCVEWSQKPESEQKFLQFWQSISAVAQSNGTKFRTNPSSRENSSCQSSAMDDKNDIVSLYLFGEDEELGAGLESSEGLIEYTKVAHLYCYDKTKPKTELSQQYLAISNKFAEKNMNGVKMQNSVSCVIS
ncbi:hypothetical protein Ahia01_000476500 [Argonauta hians]